MYLGVWVIEGGWFVYLGVWVIGGWVVCVPWCLGNWRVGGLCTLVFGYWGLGGLCTLVFGYWGLGGLSLLRGRKVTSPPIFCLFMIERI